MPYKRYNRRPYRGRRRKYPRRSFKPWHLRKYSAYDIASKAWSTAKYLKGLINVEFKKHDTEAGTTTSGNVILLNGIAQGDTDLTRDGNSLLMKSLLIRGNLITSASAASTRIRLVIFRDNQQIGDTAPAQGDILDGTFSDPIVAPLNNETVGRFTVLMNRVYCLNQMVTAQSISREWKFYTKMNLHARYNGAAATDIQKNGIYLLVVHDQPTYSPLVNYSGRLTFVDN